MSSHSPISSVPSSVPNPRKATQLSAALDHRLTAYALIAGVAGVSTAAFAQSSPENTNTIQYTPANIPFVIGVFGHGLNTINIDINSDGITDMKIKINEGGFSVTASYSYYGIGFWSAPAGNGGVTRPLGSGIEIGPVREFVQEGGLATAEIMRSRGGHRKYGCVGPFDNRTSIWE